MEVKKLSWTAAMTALTILPGMLVHFLSPGLVPFSILPVLVLLSGIILGANYGALAMLAYVALGLFGLPVFAGAPYGGFGYVLKPTFGYLIGYIGAAYVTGLIYRPGSLIRAFSGVLGGLVVLHITGAAYLYIIMRWVLDKPTTIAGVLMIGLVPFIAADLIKAGIAAIVGNEVVKRWQGLKRKNQ